MRDIDREFQAELEDLMSILAESNLEAEAEMFAPPAPKGPIFDLTCTGCKDGECIACPDGQCAGCPVHGGECRAILQNAIVEGIRLARNAANLVEATLKLAPAKRDEHARRTADIFNFFFCHDPLAFVPWAKGPSGATVVRRLRAAANELAGGRRVRFVCRGVRNDCRQVNHADTTCCTPNDNAFTLPGLHSTIFLCPPFWADQNIDKLPELQRRAATIVHEMLHNLYDMEDSQFKTPPVPTPRRFDAHCYEGFILQLDNRGVDPADIDQCQNFPCEVRI
jgi:hypothetical protein